jgi:hypothetical protein
MNEQSEPEPIREFREMLARDEPTRDVTVVYQVSGGMPGEDVGPSGPGGTLRLIGDGHLNAPGEMTVQLDPEETRQLLQQVASSLDSLVPRSEARFLPDSAVGSVTIGVRGREATLYFLADEGQRQGQEERIAQGAAEAVLPLREMVRRLRGEGGRGQ